MTSSMIASRSSNGRNADFIALMVNQRRSLERVAERLDQRGHLLAHRGLAHQPVVGVDRDPEPQPREQPDRVLGDRRGGAGLHVGVRAHLERDPLVADVRRQPAERRRAVVVDRDVVDDPDAVAEPVGAAPLDRLPDRRQPERLAGVDREVGVLALEVLERVEVPGGRVARLGAGDVEAGDARGRARRRRARRSRGERAWWRIAVSSWRTTILPPAGGHPLVEARLHRGDDLVEGQPAGRRAARGRSAPRRTRRRRRPGPRRTRGRPGSSAVGRLHHRDRVVEGLEVAHQRAGVGRLGEPAAERRRRRDAGSAWPISAASSTIVCGPQPAVEVVVQQDLGRAARSASRVGGGLVRWRSGMRPILVRPPPRSCRDAHLHQPRRARRPPSARSSAPATGSRSTRTGSTRSPTRPATTSGSTSTSSARRPGPFGGTIAHGYLTLSLIPMLGSQVFAPRDPRRQAQLRRQQGPLPRTRCRVGSRIRAHVTVGDVTDVPAGKQVTFGYTIEIEGGTKPGLRRRDRRPAAAVTPG